MIDPLEVAQREFDTMLSRFFGGRTGEMSTGGGAQTGWAPFGVDIREDADHFYVEAELPGFKKDEIDITLENQTLTITTEKRCETQQGNAGGGREAKANESQPQGDYLLRERRWSRFQGSFTLPPTVDESSVQAKLNDGVLTITLNKREETKPRKFSVS
jgi:HSP20 family protein